MLILLVQWNSFLRSGFWVPIKRTDWGYIVCSRIRRGILGSLIIKTLDLRVRYSDPSDPVQVKAMWGEFLLSNFANVRSVVLTAFCCIVSKSLVPPDLQEDELISHANARGCLALVRGAPPSIESQSVIHQSIVNTSYKASQMDVELLSIKKCYNECGAQGWWVPSRRAWADVTS